MEKTVYRSYEELPPMLTGPDVAVVPGGSRTGAYDLAHNAGFPVLKIGSQIVIPNDKFLLRIEKRCGGEVRYPRLFSSTLCSGEKYF